MSKLQRQVEALKREIPKRALLAVEVGDYLVFYGDDADIARVAIGCKRADGVKLKLGRRTAFAYVAVELLKRGHTICVAEIVERCGAGMLARREVTKTLTQEGLTK